MEFTGLFFILVLTLIVGVFILIVGVFILINVWGKNFTKGKTLDDYKRAHPSSFQRDKFSSCHHCGGGVIWMKRLGNTFYGIHHAHVCRQCGAELWRSSLR